MRYGIIADVHGNLEALEVVLQALEGVDRYLYLGDVVGYGPNPNECCAAVRGLNNCITICGNHDMAAVGKYDVSWFNPYARAAILWTSGQLSSENRRFLEDLPERYDESSFIMVHGSLVDPVSEYITSPWEARQSFALLKHPICFIGHTHVAEYYVQEPDVLTPHQVLLTRGGSIKIRQNQKYIINCGGVGQPRDGNPKASFGIYDAETNEIEIKRVEYPIQKTQDKMIKAGLPAVLYLRLWEGF